MMRDSSGIRSPAEAVGIAAALDALVVVEHPDGLPRELGAAEDLVPQRGVRLDRRVLRRIQRGRLLQDGVGHADLAHVVDEPREPELLHALVVEPEARGDERAQLGHRLAVAAGPRVLGVHRPRERGGERRLVARSDAGAAGAATSPAVWMTVRRPVRLAVMRAASASAMSASRSAPAVGGGDARADRGRARGQRRVQALREVEGVPRAGAGQHGGELVAADAIHAVPAAGDVPQRGGDALDEPVARLVAAGVVDPLEPVEVDHDERDRGPVARRAGQLAPRSSSKARWLRMPVRLSVSAARSSRASSCSRASSRRRRRERRKRRRPASTTRPSGMVSTVQRSSDRWERFSAKSSRSDAVACSGPACVASVPRTRAHRVDAALVDAVGEPWSSGVESVEVVRRGRRIAPGRRWPAGARWRTSAGRRARAAPGRRLGVARRAAEARAEGRARARPRIRPRSSPGARRRG